MQPLSKACHRIFLALWSRVQNGHRYFALRQWPLSLHLITLVLSALLPMAVAFGWVLMAYADCERRNIDAVSQAPVVDLAHTLGAELKGLSAALLSLANSDDLRRGDWASFYDHAKQAPIPNGGWVVVKRPSGEILVHTLRPYGEPIEPSLSGLGNEGTNDVPGQIYVSGVYRGQTAGKMVFTVGTSMIINGEKILVKIALPATFLRDEIERSIAHVPMPTGFNISVMGPQGRIMARVPDYDRYVGALASERFRSMVFSPSAPSRGSFHNASSINGQEIMGSYYKIPEGWTVSVGIPYAQYWWSWNMAITILFLGGAGFALCAVAIATGLSREIRNAMDQLGVEADKLAGDSKVTRVKSYVIEINKISEALDQACLDLAERRRIKTLLMREVDHRVRNSMATILSLARNSCRPGEDCASALARFQGRLIALANVHDVLVNRKWAGADLVPLIQAELKAFTDRAKVVGPVLMVSARMALSLSLAFHELATNAVKYGALSALEGRVIVKAFVVDVEQEGSQRELHIIWSERGGPTVVEPTRRGFGSRLIRAAAQNELTGSVAFDYQPKGLQVRIIVPLPDRDPTTERALPWQEELGSVEVLVAPDPPALSHSAL